jgi:hypothetical protein
MEGLEAFLGVLGQLLAGDNPTRRAAEGAYEQYRQNPDVCIQLLLASLGEEAATYDARQMAAVMLRRAIGKTQLSLWANLSPQVQAHTQEQLLVLVEQLGLAEQAAEAAELQTPEQTQERMAAEQNKKQQRMLRSKAADCVAALAVLILDPESKVPGQWEGLLPFLFRIVQSDVSGHRESSLNIFRMLAAYLGDQLVAYVRLALSPPPSPPPVWSFVSVLC